MRELLSRPPDRVNAAPPPRQARDVKPVHGCKFLRAGSYDQKRSALRKTAP